MRAVLRNVGHVTICQVVGNLEFLTVDELRAVLDDLVAVPRLVLDLSGVAFVDSSGIGALIGALRRSRETGSAVAVCSPRPSVNRVLDLVGLDRLVPVVANVEQALAALASPTGLRAAS